MSMQIGHYKTDATIIKNEFSKNCENLRINPQKAIFVRFLPRDLRINERLMVGPMLWYYFILHNFVFWFIFPGLWKFNVNFWDCNLVLAKSLCVSGRTGDLLLATCRKRSVFPVNHQSENCFANKRIYFLCQFSHCTNFYGFYLMDHKPCHARVGLEI